MTMTNATMLALQKPNGLIYLAYEGAVILAAGVLTLGVGLIRSGNKFSRQ